MIDRIVTVNSDARVSLTNRVEIIQLTQERKKKVTGIENVPNVHVIREDAIGLGDVHSPCSR